MNTRKVECPRCHRIWTAYEGEGDMTCNCHLYCEDGTKPSDCSVSATSFSGQLGWPKGIHTGNPPGKDADDVMHRYFYCSTHNNYIMKSPIVIEVDWTRSVPKRLTFAREV